MAGSGTGTVEQKVDVLAKQDITESWCDKYEPRELEDIVGQDAIVGALVQMAKSGLLTHLIFAGDPGVGKTTAANCFARRLLGPAYQSNFEVYNASSKDRGIDFVRENLMNTATSAAVGSAVKIVFLDEVDGMTGDAQNALRGIMKEYSKNVIFILACNYLNRVIPAISHSRCALLRFGRIKKEIVIKRMKFILESEKAYVHDEIVELIAEATRGDLRSAINLMQVSFSMLEAGVTKDFVMASLEAWKPVSTTLLVKESVDGNVVKVRHDLDGHLSRGVSPQEVLASMSDEIARSGDISDMKFKGDMLKMIADASGRINDGSPERIQFNAIIAGLAAHKYRNGSAGQQFMQRPTKGPDVASGDEKAASLGAMKGGVRKIEMPKKPSAGGPTMPRMKDEDEEK